jgi:hypothetical protein
MIETVARRSENASGEFKENGISFTFGLLVLAVGVGSLLVAAYLNRDKFK